MLPHCDMFAALVHASIWLRHIITFSASLISTDAGVCTCNSFSGDATSLAWRLLWQTPRESDDPSLLSHLRHRLPDPASSALSIPARSGEDAETGPSRTQTWSRGPASCGQDRTGQEAMRSRSSEAALKPARESGVVTRWWRFETRRGWRWWRRASGRAAWRASQISPRFGEGKPVCPHPGDSEWTESAPVLRACPDSSGTTVNTSTLYNNS